MSERISIRNLTTHHLTLSLIERFEDPLVNGISPNPSAGFFSNITSNVTSLLGNDTGPGQQSTGRIARLAENAQSFKKNGVQLKLGPMSIHRSEIKVSEKGPNEILRLTFTYDESTEYQINISPTTTTSQPLNPTTANPTHEFTGLYLPSSTLLTIFETTSLQNWMSTFPDTTPLQSLSLPGTHNTPTSYLALPSVRCQQHPLSTQLATGIRFLDIRLQPAPTPSNPTTLNLVHGAFPISLTGPKTLAPLLATLQTFLTQNPSETILLSLKREGTGSATDHDLATLLHKHYIAPNPDLWHTAPSIPTLGAARGKLVLLRRFALPPALQNLHSGHGWGLNAENWAYNTANCTYGDVCVQDFCEVLETNTITHKISVSCAHFERAGARRGDSGKGPLYLNFLSGSNFWKMGCWPDRIAERVNPAVLQYLCAQHHVDTQTTNGDGDGGVGIVVCDWVGRDGNWDLIRCIIAMNGWMKLKSKGRTLESMG